MSTQTPQAIPAPPKTVKVSVDGIEVEADARDNLIEAARRVGVSIPYFCYHPRLSIAAQCRICLVETSDAPGRLVAGCQVRVKEGLKIITNTPAVKDNQRGSMEFHLINHPVDCAICDQSGECKLQDYYMEYDHQPSRIRTYKINKPKREVFGPVVVYDAERCIMCTRCVRFMDEVAQEPQLAVVQRGAHSLIATFPDQPLDSKYSGNTVDICPVGALLNRDFRFQSRVWFVDKSPSVCTGCANGCNTYVESRGDQIYRLLPRRNEEVNQVWMCDDGRTTYHATNEGRVVWARTGRGENHVENVGPHLAGEKAKSLLAPLANAPGLAFAVSAQCTVEEAAAAFALGKSLGVSRWYLGGQPDGEGDDFLIRPDRNPNRRGVELLAKAHGAQLRPVAQLAQDADVKALVAFRTDGLALLGGDRLARLEVFVALAQNEDQATATADVVLPVASVYEQDGSLVNWYGRLQRTWAAVPARKGDSLAAWAWANRMSAQPLAATVQQAFALAAKAVPELSGRTFDDLPDDGVTLQGLLPNDWPARAPRPAAATAASGGRS